MFRRVALVRTDVSEERTASNIRVTSYFLRSLLRLLVTANVIPRSQISFTLMMKEIRSSETSVLTRDTQRNIPEDGILLSHSRENVKSYIALTGWLLYRPCNVSPVKYEMGFYIPEDGILHSHRRENLQSYIALTGWTL
jgi:hypothetical protein